MVTTERFIMKVLIGVGHVTWEALQFSFVTQFGVCFIFLQGLQDWGDETSVLLCMTQKLGMMSGTGTVLLITHELLRNTTFCFAQAKKIYPPCRNQGKTLQAPSDLVILFKPQLLFCFVTSKQHLCHQRWFVSSQF